MTGSCALTPSFDRPGRSDPARHDVLRLERFGALYYARDRAAFFALDHARAQLLLDSRESGLFEAWARLGAESGIDRFDLAMTAAEWRRAGMVDEAYRCQARVVDVDRSHDALAGPMVTHVQLTRACNLRCTHCFAEIMAKRAPDEMSLSDLDALFRALSGLGSPLVVLAGGEPLLRPDLLDILEGVRAHDLDGWLCTNATMVDARRAKALVASGLRGFSVSLDGPDADSHEYLRGRGRFAPTYRGIRNLVEAGAEDVQLRVTVTPHNASRLLEFVEVAADLGATKVRFKAFRQTGAAAHAHELFINMNDYLEAIERTRAAWPNGGCPAEFGDGMPTRLPEWTRAMPAFGCVGGTTSAAVLYDGRVVACDAVLTPEDWNLKDHGFAACWRKAPSLDGWRHLGGNDQCHSCHNFTRCGGGCRARSLAIGRSIQEPDPWAFCSKDAEAPRPRLAVLG